MSAAIEPTPHHELIGVSWERAYTNDSEKLQELSEEVVDAQEEHEKIYDIQDVFVANPPSLLSTNSLLIAPSLSLSDPVISTRHISSPLGQYLVPLPGIFITKSNISYQSGVRRMCSRCTWYV